MRIWQCGLVIAKIMNSMLNTYKSFKSAVTKVLLKNNWHSMSYHYYEEDFDAILAFVKENFDKHDYHINIHTSNTLALLFRNIDDLNLLKMIHPKKIVPMQTHAGTAGACAVNNNGIYSITCMGGGGGGGIAGGKGGGQNMQMQIINQGLNHSVTVQTYSMPPQGLSPRGILDLF